MQPEEVGERLRSKHIRTLELLAKVIDENAALKKKGELEVDLGKLVEDLQQENESLRSASGDAARKLEEAGRARAEAEQKLRDLSIQIKNQEIGWGKKLAAAEDKAIEDDRTIEGLRREVAELQAKLREMGERYGEAGAMAGRAAAAQAELDKSQRECAALRAQLLAVERQAAELQAAAQRTGAEQGAERQQMEGRLRQAEADKQQLEGSVARLQRDLEAARGTIASQKRDCALHKKELESLRSEAGKGQEGIGAAQAEVKRLQEEVKRLQEENEELRKRVSQLERALHQAQQEKAREPSPDPSTGNFSEFVQLKREIARLQARLADISSSSAQQHAGLTMSVSVNVGSGPPLQKLPVVPATALPVGRSNSLSRPRIA